MVRSKDEWMDRQEKWPATHILIDAKTLRNCDFCDSEVSADSDDVHYASPNAFEATSHLDCCFHQQVNE